MENEEMKNETSNGLMDLDSVIIDPSCVVKLSSAVALRKLILPLCVIDGIFHAAVADDLDLSTSAILEKEVGMKIKTHRVDMMQLKAVLLKVYGDERGIQSYGTVVDMLVAYYSRGCDSRELFKDLKIAQHPSFEKHLNKYNVIHVNMLDIVCENVSFFEFYLVFVFFHIVLQFLF